MPGIGNIIGIPFRQGANLNHEPPTDFVSTFNVDTISADLSWTDTNGGVAQYEIFRATNGGAESLIFTTAKGATSYSDTGCKQNASVVYKVKTKGTNKEASASALVTPLCCKTDQSTLSTVTINTLNIQVGKTVTVNWGDGTSQAYTGNNSSITKNYAATGQYNISISGDVNSITILQFLGQFHITGDIGNWIIPTVLSTFNVRDTKMTGNITEWKFPSSISVIAFYNTDLTGAFPVIQSGNTTLLVRVYNSSLSDSLCTIFRPSMSEFDLSNQKIAFPTANIDKLLKSFADWYEVNAPTANCTFNLSGANMGIPTDGAANADITRLVGYYTAASKTATVIVRTS